MKITVYVDWNENTILSEKDFEKEILNEADESFNDSDCFDEWLTNNFDPSEVFNFTEAEKETQRARFKEYCLEDAREYLFDNKYETIELEV
jgi:hypothetical protein